MPRRPQLLESVGGHAANLVSDTASDCPPSRGNGSALCAAAHALRVLHLLAEQGRFDIPPGFMAALQRLQSQPEVRLPRSHSQVHMVQVEYGQMLVQAQREGSNMAEWCGIRADCGHAAAKQHCQGGCWLFS